MNGGRFAAEYVAEEVLDTAWCEAADPSTMPPPWGGRSDQQLDEPLPERKMVFLALRLHMTDEAHYSRGQHTLRSIHNPEQIVAINVYAMGASTLTNRGTEERRPLHRMGNQNKLALATVSMKGEGDVQSRVRKTSAKGSTKK